MPATRGGFKTLNERNSRGLRILNRALYHQHDSSSTLGTEVSDGFPAPQMDPNQILTEKSYPEAGSKKQESLSSALTATGVQSGTEVSDGFPAPQIDTSEIPTEKSDPDAVSQKQESLSSALTAIGVQSNNPHFPESLIEINEIPSEQEIMNAENVVYTLMENVVIQSNALDDHPNINTDSHVSVIETTKVFPGRTLESESVCNSEREFSEELSVSLQFVTGELPQNEDDKSDDGYDLDFPDLLGPGASKNEHSQFSDPTLSIGESGRRKMPAQQKRVKAKALKETGSEYTNCKGITVPKKSAKPGCDVDKCIRKCMENFSDEDRETIHSQYWGLAPIQKKEFELKSIIRNVKQRSTVENSRRDFTRHYFLPKNGTFIRVCRKFYLSTLDVGQKKVRYTEENRGVIMTAKKDKRGIKSSANKTPPRSIQIVRVFIEKLPAVPSHYSRSRTSKKYLPEEWKNLNNIYRIYRSYCVENDYCPVSDYVFRRIFKTEYNIGVHSPKKDKCSVCLKFTALTNPSDDERRLFEGHNLEKKARNALYEAGQNRAATDDTFVTASFDLQKVLQTPAGKSMLFFYSRKYAVYNLTVYESKTQKVFCYMWGEKDGKRGSNEICTCLEKYLNQLDDRKVKEVALWCDNCPGQQKNMATLAFLSTFLEKAAHLQKITLNFLLAGHTMMTVDSVHAVIERAARSKTIHSPSEWITIVSNARFNPFPYEVVKVNYFDWKNWKAFGESKAVQRLSDGTAFKINELQKLIFERRDVQRGKFTFFKSAVTPEEMTGIFTNKRKRSHLPAPEQLYFGELPISLKKYNDLKELRSKYAIPVHFHKEYFDLRHDGTVEDTLAQTDEEDLLD